MFLRQLPLHGGWGRGRVCAASALSGWGLYAGSGPARVDALWTYVWGYDMSREQGVMDALWTHVWGYDMRFGFILYLIIYSDKAGKLENRFICLVELHYIHL
jgi:hypothetical protein